MIGLGDARHGLPEAGVLTGGLVVRVVTLGQAALAPTDLAAAGHDESRGERILHTCDKARRGRFGFLGRTCAWVAGGIGRGIGEAVGMGFGISKAARRAGGPLAGAGGGVMAGLRLVLGGGGGGMVAALRLLVSPTLLSLLVAMPVTADDCVLGDIPDSLKPEQLLEKYLDVAFDANVCLPDLALGRDCGQRISRIDSDYFISFAGLIPASESERNSIAQQLDKTSSEIFKATGFHAYAQPKAENPTMLVIYFVDDKRASMDPENFAKKELSWFSPYAPERIADAFVPFEKSSADSCMTMNLLGDDEAIKVSLTLIKAEKSISEINQCVARAFIGGIGLNGDGVFQSGSDESTERSNSVFEIPTLFKKLITLHYSRYVSLGMTRDALLDSEDVLKQLNCSQ